MSILKISFFFGSQQRIIRTYVTNYRVMFRKSNRIGYLVTRVNPARRRSFVSIGYGVKEGQERKKRVRSGRRNRKKTDGRTVWREGRDR